MGFVDLFRRDESRESEIKTLASLETWMAELPLMDFAKSAIEINNSLSRLTNSSFKDEALLDRLILYYDSIKQLSDLAYQRYTDTTAGTLEVRRAEFFFIRDMHLNYGDLFYELLFGEKKAKLSKEAKLKAGVFAHACYAYGLLRTYQMFIYVPKLVWTKIYTLYVEMKSVANESKGSLGIKGGFPLGIWPLSGFYALVILSTTNPNQSEPFELEEIFHFVCANANESMFSERDHDSAQFCLSMQSDKGPQLKYHFSTKETARLYIDISYLYQLLATSKQVLSLGVEKKLTKIWDFKGDRQLERTEEQGVVEVLENLSLIHDCFVTKKNDLPSQAASVNTKKDIEINTEQAAILNYYNEHFDLAQTENKNNTLHKDFMRWQLSNVSQSGACLVNPSSDPLYRLNVGELVLVKGVSMDKKPVVAVVRWLSLREGRGVLMGLEYISKDIEAVQVQNETQRKNGFQYKALLASHTVSTWPDVLLITPILSYHAQEQIHILKDVETQQEVTLTECVERTSNAIFFKIKA